ncbi:Chitinase [Bathymodiolus thermophilus thioautotrophic gill symbiont]|uniref:BspA family leucine-rich repeat surface protein n=1 Tax=Bathymodiolus thermophilus thioautotrophic gill symbiont TaxID=2360 RepID=UPI0010B614FD|nr:BspA family leucine-rich repeat surface protein [Bathymodiolus thermophilus thioautotrophic gill symbiont]SGZ64586.1 Chitinase [Bathymodiolus thermophilus thioautotrophic gill symbiont]
MVTFKSMKPVAPTLIITGNGGINTAANIITFNFSKAIKDRSFTIHDIDIENGTINPSSFTKVSATQYTIAVTPHPGGVHSNVAITVSANTFVDIAGNANAVVVRNITQISYLKNKIDIDGVTAHADLTNWNVSHVSNANRAFSNTHTFNQDIGSWNVSNVTDMSNMFYNAHAFNQSINSWDVSKVATMSYMFYNAHAFDQCIGSWDISGLINATGMFNGNAMSIINMDYTLRGWAKLDTAAGETAIQGNVTWGIANYTDATAKQYLIDTYNWTINMGNFDGSKTIQGTAAANTLATTGTKTTIHGLGGNDTLKGGATNDILVGGAGDDTLTGAGGRDVFDYGFKNAGNDIITDFFIGDVIKDTRSDIIDLKDLLIGYKANSKLSDFVTATAEGTGTKLTIDHDGNGALHNLVTITLSEVAYSDRLLSDMIANGNLVLRVIRPILRITGGGNSGSSNIITFNFSEDIKDGSFTVDDIDIVNGTINPGSFTKVNATLYTIAVTPSLGGKHDNVAITVAVGTFTDIAGNSNITSENATTIIVLKDRLAIDGSNSDVDLTNWDVSHVNIASQAFYKASSFNQDIGGWDVSNVVDMSWMFCYANMFNQNIGDWNVGKVVDMRDMFVGTRAFNQDINSWDVSKVFYMQKMFSGAIAFNQDIGGWNISRLLYATDMFSGSAMTVVSMDNTLRGWAKLDTAAGETDIQFHVTWTIANYTDATAKQYLMDTYGWHINGGKFDGSKTIQGSNRIDTLHTDAKKMTLHGLGGNDTLTGGTTDDVLVGGAGNDHLIGKGGRDIFYFGFENAGKDTITDFTVGDINKNTDADIIDLSNLLVGYSASKLSDFITAESNGGSTELIVDYNGAEESHSKVTIVLINVAYNKDLLANLIANGNLELEKVRPTLKIVGNGGGGRNIITFNFHEAIGKRSFTMDDISIANGTIDAGSFTKVSETQYTIRVSHDLGASHSNIAITVAANTFVDAVGNTNAIVKNTTKIPFLDKLFDIGGKGGAHLDVNLTNWDVSHVSDASNTFNGAKGFNQDIGGWDVSNMTNMYRMFYRASDFNQNIGSWNVSNVTNMEEMFFGVTAFNQDIDSWDVSNVTNMRAMLSSTVAFNQDIGSWDVSNVTNMREMFLLTRSFSQNIGNWDISSLTNATYMLHGSAMNIADMDSTLRGWARLDTFAGEAAIQRNVTWTIVSYTDATAKQYLIDTYGWTIDGGFFDSSRAIQGRNTPDVLIANFQKTTLHGLGGNDTLIGGAADDVLVGGAGNDHLTGKGGRDIFDYGFKNAGHDIITDFTIGNVSTNTNADTIDLSDLLIGYRSAFSFDDLVSSMFSDSTKLANGNAFPWYEAYSLMSDYITAVSDGDDTKLIINYDGIKALDSLVTITLKNVTYSDDLLANLIVNGNLVLEAVSPTLTITGSGGIDIAANTITFNFSKAIKDGLFTVDNINIENGAINAGSFTRVSETQYTIQVTPNLGGKHSNVAVMVAANTFVDVAGDINTVITKNTTKLNTLKDRVDIDGKGHDTDLTNWSVSHVNNASKAFDGAQAFNQDIGRWDVSKVTNMSKMFQLAHSFNQDIGKWNVDNVTNMSRMFYSASAFNQNIGNWNISSLTHAEDMFYGATNNMDDILRGWAKLDTAAGETAIQEKVKWSIGTYTDATARQYLIDTYDWYINYEKFDDSKTMQGTSSANTLVTISTKTTLHGLGGDDTLIGGSTDDTLIGGAGNDTLTGEDGRDSFYYGFENAGNDIITDFTVGKVSTNANADVINLSNLLVGYSSAVNLSDFVTAAANSTGGTRLTIDHDGIKDFNDSITIALSNVTYSTHLLIDLIANGNLVLEPVKPTLTIVGCGGKDAAANTITFNFNEVIKHGSFTVDDIDIVNGTINSGSFTKVSDTKYTITVTPSLGGMHSNVAITVAAGAFTDIAGNANATTKNTTKLYYLKTLVDTQPGKCKYGVIYFDLTDWDVSHVTNAGRAFASSNLFNQDISGWDVSNMIDMSGMFFRTDDFNQNINSWDVSGATDMHQMFSNTYVFNQDLSSWDVGNVTIMTDMFRRAIVFNQDISSWNVGEVINMFGMFYYAADFNQNIGNWNVSKVTDMALMFGGTVVFNQDIGSWDVGNVTNMDSMFFRAITFNQDLCSWNVGKVTDMTSMFWEATAFNQDIGNWNVGKVTTMQLMFAGASAFNQDIGSWDISSLIKAKSMFTEKSVMANMDNILRGWAKLDTEAGETAIQSNVEWGIANYTDATARQYLIDTYSWIINDNFDGSKTIQGTADADTLTAISTKTTIHGLGGDDTLKGGATNDILVGGAGNDTLTGEGGRDVFDYGFKNAGNDIITDFIVGDTNTNANADVIDLKDLLIGHGFASHLSDFVTATASGTGTKLTISHDGTGVLNSSVTITLTDVGYSANLLNDMIAEGNLVLV